MPGRRIPNHLRIGQLANWQAGQGAEVAVVDQRAVATVDPVPQVDELKVDADPDPEPDANADPDIHTFADAEPDAHPDAVHLLTDSARVTRSRCRPPRRVSGA